MRKTELQNEKKQFGIYGFFIIFSAYIFKLFILRATENMYFSYEDGLYYGISVGAEIQNLSLEIAYRVNEGEINTSHGKYDIDNSRVMFGAGYKFNF